MLTGKFIMRKMEVNVLMIIVLFQYILPHLINGSIFTKWFFDEKRLSFTKFNVRDNHGFVFFIFVLCIFHER